MSSLLRCVSFDRGICIVLSGESPDFCDIRVVSTILSAYYSNPVSSNLVNSISLICELVHVDDITL